MPRASPLNSYLTPAPAVLLSGFVSLITLLTDFGTRDWFAGTMKGVILGINSRAAIVDVTHQIAPGDIRSAAFALRASYKFFPKGTIHVVVVDPGVGRARKGMVVRTRDYFFVGPDNGVLSWALGGQKILHIGALENHDYFLPSVSCTFHGRDIFAPVAAHLGRGVQIQKFGPPLKNIVRLPWPSVRKSGGVIQGEVVYVDHFGNAI